MPPWSILFANILNAHLPKILTPPSTLGKRTKKIKYDIPIFKRALSLFVDKNPKRKREKQGAKNMYRGLTVYRCIMYSGPCGRRASLLLPASCLLQLHNNNVVCGQTWRRRDRRLIGKGRPIPNSPLLLLRLLNGFGNLRCWVEPIWDS